MFTMLQRFLHIIFICLPGIVFGQNIGWVYQHMPIELDPYLTTSQRFELIEYAKEGRQETFHNRWNGQASIVTYDEQQNLLKVSQTANSTLSLKLHPIDSTHYLIIAIRTVSAPIKSSTITIYNQHWQRKEISLPNFQAKDFLISQQSFTQEDLEALTPIFVSADFSSTSDMIEFTNQTIQILSTKEQERYKPFLQTYMIPLSQILP